MRIYKIGEILEELEYCIDKRMPFSHIRFGDGGIKYIHAVLTNDIKQLKTICKKEGIPFSRILDVFKLWGYYARRANFIDTPEVYFSNNFWERLRKPGKAMTQDTYKKMKSWWEYYEKAELDNYRYCNPESNYLMILNLDQPNLISILREKKTCIITAYPEVKNVLPNYFDVDIVPIAGQYEDQYNKSYDEVNNFIQENAQKYDLWLVAAGELGRIYSGEIKEYGGRCVDIGFVIEYWLGKPIHPRLKLFMEPDKKNKLQLKLTEKWGCTYKDCI